MSISLIKYFGYPAEGLSLKSAQELGGEPGFFRFGSDTVCYGRSVRGSLGADPAGPLYDASSDVLTSNSGVQLPFDLSEVLDNLRYERYVGVRHSNNSGIVRDLYYTIRPLLPVALRRPLQRIRLRGWNTIPFPKWPVDTTVERLLGKILALAMKAHGIAKLPFIWFWPDSFNAALMLTHDVETRKGRDFCSDLMDLDASFGIPSSFQVIPEQRYQLSDTFLNSIRERGFEINIHDLNHDGNLFRDRSTFLSRAQRINHYAERFGALGFRSAVLYRNLSWFDAFTFSYDMSVPNVAHLDPQRGGCCTVMPFEVGNILELPLTTTQDYSLFNVLGQYSLALWRQQIEHITQAHGLVSFNIHPDYVIAQRARRCYASLLEYIRSIHDSLHLWVARPGEIAEWWRHRARLRLVNDKGWRIQGADSERARVAWAILDGDNVRYILPAHRA